MTSDLSITEEHFNQLLAWLDADPVRAGEKYETIRRRLIVVFLNRRCEEAEDLADDTINRVAKKAGDLKDSYVGEPERYFYGVAKNVWMEYLRRRSRRLHLLPPPVASRSELGPHLNCLDECLDKLDPDSRDLILSYYQEQKQAKISSHKEMGDKLRLKAGALRARAFRIRVKLEKCMRECLERAPESNDISLNAI
jgi:RNA polymerase sigma factor (sigma-70 family)